MLYTQKSTGEVYQLIKGPHLDVRAFDRVKKALKNDPEAICNPEAHIYGRCRCKVDSFDLMQRPVVQVVTIIRINAEITERPKIWDFDLFKKSFEKTNRE